MQDDGTAQERKLVSRRTAALQGGVVAAFLSLCVYGGTWLYLDTLFEGGLGPSPFLYLGSGALAGGVGVTGYIFFSLPRPRPSVAVYPALALLFGVAIPSVAAFVVVLLYSLAGRFEGKVLMAIPLFAIHIPGTALGFLVGLMLRFRKNAPPYPGSCRTCDYNLTGNLSGTCPECGTAVE